MAGEVPGQNPSMSAQEGAPTQKVLQMRQQGLSNNQIIQMLQRDGNQMDQIFSAMNQADIKQGVDFGGKDPTSTLGDGAALQNPALMPGDPARGAQPFYTQAQQGTDYDAQGQSVGGTEGQPQFPPLDQGMGATYPSQGQEMGMQQPVGPPDMGGMGEFAGGEMGGGMQQSSFGNERERIEELAEAIIDEKWNEIVRSINKIVDWKERMETRISKMEQEFGDMKKGFETLHKGVLGKIGQYDENLSNVGTSIKAMEQVFQKVLPTLTENVNALSSISKRLGEE